jgi:hypothetical protein
MPKIEFDKVVRDQMRQPRPGRHLSMPVWIVVLILVVIAYYTWEMLK